MKIRPSNDTEWRQQNGDYTYRINYPLTNNSIVVVTLLLNISTA